LTDAPGKTKASWQVEEVRDGMQSAIDTYVILRRASDAVARYVDSGLNKQGLTTAQYGILLHLWRGESLSLTDLSGLVFRSNSALTSLIDRMERDGLVARAADANDRRVTTVQLTPQGKELLLRIRERHRPFLADMMGGLSPDELDQLGELLENLRTNIEAEQGRSSEVDRPLEIAERSD